MSNTRAWLLLFAVMVMSPIRAQVAGQGIVNGTFENGPNDWLWSQAVVPALYDCNSKMTAFTSFWDEITPYLSQTRGRVAAGALLATLGNGIWDTCRRIEQSFIVPVGSDLKYDAEWIAASAGTTGDEQTALEISVFDVGTGREFSLVTSSGPCSVSVDCGVRSYSENISKFWGRQISLRFTTKSRTHAALGKLISIGAQVRLDNIRVEKLPTVTGATPTAGQWYNPARSGNGIHLSRSSTGDFLLLWYTYLPSGKAIWYISDVKPMISGVMASPIYKSIWNPVTGQNSLTPVGDIRLEMVSEGMNLFWDLHSFNGNNSGFDGGEPFRLLLGGGSYTGLWYEPALSGWGVSVDYKNNTNGVDTIGTVFYYDGTEPVWAQAQAEGAPNSGALWGVTEFTGHGLCPECFAQPISLVPRVAGALGLNLDANQGWIDITQSSGQFWRRGSPTAPVGIFRLTQP